MEEVDLKENVHGRDFERKCDLGENSRFDLGIDFGLDLSISIQYLRKFVGLLRIK